MKESQKSDRLLQPLKPGVGDVMVGMAFYIVGTVF